LRLHRFGKDLLLFHLHEKICQTPPASAAWSINFNLPRQPKVLFLSFDCQHGNSTSGFSVNLDFRSLAIETEKIVTVADRRLKVILPAAEAGGV
jgi:hypothetical protein